MRILLAEDDVDDRTLAALAFSELPVKHDLVFVQDGQQLMDHLLASLQSSAPLPDLIVLDLNMPRKDGRTALREIKNSPELKGLRVVIFSTSSAPEDKKYTRDLGALEYYIKPSDFRQLQEIFTTMSTFT